MYFTLKLINVGLIAFAIIFFGIGFAFQAVRDLVALVQADTGVAAVILIIGIYLLFKPKKRRKKF